MDDATNLLTLIPLAAFWASFQSLLSAAKYVNEVREKTTAGWDNGVELSVEHRKAMLDDWCFLMAGAILGAWTFAGIIWWTGCYLSPKNIGGISYLLFGVSAVEALYGISFVLCAFSDYRLMSDAIKKYKKKLEAEKG